MPRGTTFGNLLTMYREEAGLPSSRALGQNAVPQEKAALRRVYRRLHTDFNWPHLLIQRDETLQGGERYYSFPTDLDFDRVTDVWIRENGEENWYPMRYDIGIPHYNSISSDSGEREDYPIAWKAFESDQFEVWPVPVTSGHTMRFFGISRAKPLVDEAEVVDLDDDMIVLYAVAEHKARNKDADAEFYLQQARQHYMRLRGNSQKDNTIDMRVDYDRHPRWSGINIRYAELRE